MNSAEIVLFLAGALWGTVVFAAANHYAHAGDAGGGAGFRGFKCPSCGAWLAVTFFLPFFGFFLQRRKCRHCGGRLPVLLPVMQAAGAATMPLAHHALGGTAYALFLFLVLSVAAAITAVDLLTFRIPDRLVILFFLFSLYPVLSSGSWKDGLLGAALLSVFFLVIMFFFPGSFGGGDLKYAAAMGFFLGFEFSLVALEFSLVSGTVAGVIYVMVKGKTLRSRIPFAPFLSAGLLFALVFGREIILFYLNRFF